MPANSISIRANGEISLMAPGKRGSEVANTLKNAKHHLEKKKYDASPYSPRKRSNIEHTFTSLSQPALTMTGFCGLGLKRTHDTHSVWPLSVMVYLQSPRVFHSLIERSREPETIWRLSAEKETDRTSLVWPTKVRVVWPVESSHSRRDLSQELERA